MNKSDLIFKNYHSTQAFEIFNSLAELRIKVFKDYPYLYDGDLDYETEYLERYFKASSSIVVTVWDKNRLVGASTGILLSEEMPEIQNPFLIESCNLDQIFYFGESILDKKYRGLGIGHHFFNEREQQALSFSNVKTTSFCAVKRTHNDQSKKPVDYQPLDEFWRKRGYNLDPNLKTTLKWKDIDKTEADYKELNFWLKNWK